MNHKRLISALAAACTGLLLVSCGGGDEDESTKAAKKLDPAAAHGAKGSVTWCIGKDTSGAYGESIAAYRKRTARIKVRLLELPESADEQRTQQIQRLRAKSPECDLLGMDVIWTAEYAGQGWLHDLTDAVAKREGEFIPSTLESAKFQGKVWGIPYNTNAGFIYYRKDQVGKEAPTSWEEIYRDAATKGGLVYQGARYEGLTVNFLELLYSAGGKVFSDDGKRVEVDSAVARKVLAFMADGYKRDAVPKAVTTYMEEEARRAFEAGKTTYMRNWPYAFALAKKSKVSDQFEIAAFPSYGGAAGAGVLGGFNLGISTYSRNPEAALAFASFLASPEGQRITAQAANPPVLQAAYDDPAVRKALPFADDLREAVEQAQPRPATAVYPQVSEAIYENVHAALTGDRKPDAAVSKMAGEIERALETF